MSHIKNQRYISIDSDLVWVPSESLYNRVFAMSPLPLHPPATDADTLWADFGHKWAVDIQVPPCADNGDVTRREMLPSEDGHGPGDLPGAIAVRAGKQMITSDSSLSNSAGLIPGRLESGVGSDMPIPIKKGKARRARPKGAAAAEVQATQYMTPGSISSQSTIRTHKQQAPDTNPGVLCNNTGLLVRLVVKRPNRMKAKVESGRVVKSRPK